MLKLLLPHPAAMIKTGKNKTLVIADPHLGWEMALRDKGIHVPSQTPRLLEKMTTILSKHKPDSLLILGDIKYSIVSAKPGEWHDIPEFFRNPRRIYHISQLLIRRLHSFCWPGPPFLERGNVEKKEAGSLGIGTKSSWIEF